jgi:phosphoribosyl-ATP pyrophosphohydrolase
MGYLSDLIYHTDVLVQLVSILYHVGPRGMGYLSDRIYHTDVLVQLVSLQVVREHLYDRYDQIGNPFL